MATYNAHTNLYGPLTDYAPARDDIALRAMTHAHEKRVSDLEEDMLATSDKLDYHIARFDKVTEEVKRRPGIWTPTQIELAGIAVARSQHRITRWLAARLALHLMHRGWLDNSLAQAQEVDASLTNKINIAIATFESSEGEGEVSTMINVMRDRFVDAPPHLGCDKVHRESHETTSTGCPQSQMHQEEGRETPGVPVGDGEEGAMAAVGNFTFSTRSNTSRCKGVMAKGGIALSGTEKFLEEMTAFFDHDYAWEYAPEAFIVGPLDASV